VQDVSIFTLASCQRREAFLPEARGKLDVQQVTTQSLSENPFGEAQTSVFICDFQFPIHFREGIFLISPISLILSQPMCVNTESMF